MWPVLIIALALILAGFKAGRRVLKLFFIIAGVAIFIVLFVPVTIPWATSMLGYNNYLVNGISMCDPDDCLIPPGSLMIAEAASNVSVGDVACYEIGEITCSPNQAVTKVGDVVCHQVISVDGNMVQFQGTNKLANPKPDPCRIPLENLEGKMVISIPWIGSHLMSLGAYSSMMTNVIKGGYV